VSFYLLRFVGIKFNVMRRNYGNFIDEISMYKHLHCVLNV